MSEQNIETVEGDVNVEAPAAPAEKPEADVTGDDAQQDTGALQE